ncbi:E3 ubiquitin-protein ligase NEURL3-like [Gadus macrocephalus]|uniref:E3 ubiquitin-protein ligase NEURL3-like n=1 Tax=Gadus macrocephalus TaxID=80720 RepID=UPI0028CB439C|nr:E3 ubiquitin-protein ligase NEURL3-like [Gadus macrocephalus]
MPLRDTRATEPSVEEREASMKEPTMIDSAGLHIPTCKGCLGPLHFQSSDGSKLSLKAGCRYAERQKDTFQNALAFSNRPIAIEERIHVRVERCDQHWQGALRLGFTAISPSLFAWDDKLSIANPDGPRTGLGYWARQLPTCHTLPGAELCFWVNSRGVLMYRGPDHVKKELFVGVDLGRPLWAMVDLYGQTRAVRMLGSKKKKIGFRTKKSCPATPPPAPTDGDSCLCVDRGQPCKRPRQSPSTYTQPPNSPDSTSPEVCVVCLEDCAASVTLVCGHRCLCSSCANRIRAEFGTCPICRQSI